ncbi:MAG: hypothetical protein B7Z40_10985 [Bosea sp. 12-68-7]|nr:MAG: hypothetical protein B7Z40_10985 [Bosea sp. 12-68-7]
MRAATWEEAADSVVAASLPSAAVIEARRLAAVALTSTPISKLSLAWPVVPVARAASRISSVVPSGRVSWTRSVSPTAGWLATVTVRLAGGPAVKAGVMAAEELVAPASLKP